MVNFQPRGYPINPKRKSVFRNSGDPGMAQQPAIRTPIVCVLGHVDHGKTSLLDRIRGSSVVKAEAGAITQHIGATIVPIDSITGSSASMKKMNISVPGLLFIDTPGHHAFTTLRARGGALADMAILVVDLNEGFQPQTLEALNILRTYKTPFVVAATKIDRLPGWKVTRDASFLASYAKQNERVMQNVETKIYELVGTLSDHGFSSERFDRVSDFTRNLAIVPISAHTGEGITDLLLVMIGLAQRYLEKTLKLSVEGPGAGTILEVKDERGLGMTIDLILFDGILSVGDEIAFATNDGVATTKVKALLKPRPMKEILVEDRFERVKSVVAASGIKVSAPGLDRVIAGTPVRVVRGDLDAVREEISREMSEIHVTLSPEGVVIKADTIGALEAICAELDAKKIPVMRAEVGPVSRHDIIDTMTIKNPHYRAIISFNTPMLPDAADLLRDPSCSNLKTFSGRVIYKIIDDYLAWQDESKRKEEQQRFEQIILPARIKVLPDCVFRQSNPAVVGIRVVGGTLRSNVEIIHLDGRKVGHIKTIQLHRETIQEAVAGQEVAISVEGATVGRQIDIEDDLYVDIPERHVKILEKELLSHLPISAQMILDEFCLLKRRQNPFWGK